MRIETGVWEPTLNQAIRIVIGYDGQRRPISRFNVGRDGSIYLGHRYKKVSNLFKASGRSKDGKVTFSYHEGEPVDTSLLGDPTNLSFHPSGITNFADTRVRRAPFKGISSRQLVAHVLFKHPSNFTPAGIRSSDVVLDYHIDESQPLLGRIVGVQEVEAILLDAPWPKNSVPPTKSGLT